MGRERGWPALNPQPSHLGPCPQVTASQLMVPPAVCTVLLLDSRPRPRPVYTLKEAYDNGLPLLPHALCAAIIGELHAEGHCPGQALGRTA